MAQMSDFSDPMNPTPEELAMARAYALRGIPMPPPGAPPAQPPQGDSQRALGLLSLLSGNKALGQFGETAVGNSQQRAQLEQQRPLTEAVTAEKNYGITPQAGLGGQTPTAYELLTKRQQVPKVLQGMNGEWVNAHTGQPINNGLGGGGLDPKALEQAAAMFHTTGQLPSMGMGKAGVLVRKQILNKVAELFPDANLAANKAGFHADTGSLAKLQTQADSIDAFENTALKNLNAFRQIAKGVVDVGSPLFNAPIRSVEKSIMGDPRQAQFSAARQVAVQEIGKVLGGAVQGGAITDSQRHEVEGLLSGDATLAQIEAVSQTLEQDMANRKAAISQQLGAIKQRMGGAAPPPGAPPPGAPPGNAPPGAQASPEDAEALQWLKANPQHPAAAKVAAKLKSKGLL